MPWDRDRLEPVEILGLEHGDQDRWNRLCELVAWAAWMVVMHIPSMAKSDPRKPYARFDRFLSNFPPPWYQPRQDKVKRG